MNQNEFVPIYCDDGVRYLGVRIGLDRYLDRMDRFGKVDSQVNVSLVTCQAFATES